MSLFRRLPAILGLLAAMLAVVPSVSAQDLTVDDPIVRSIYAEGIENSQLEPLAQALLDSIGPRLAGTPQFDEAANWLVAKYESWGIPVRKEQVGTWRGWRQGPTHVDLLEPRVRTLAATPMGYSPGTEGPIEGPVVLIPADLTEETADEWIQSIEGAFVLAMPPEPILHSSSWLPPPVLDAANGTGGEVSGRCVRLPAAGAGAL